MNIEIREGLPSPEEYTCLRVAVGWGTQDPEVVEKGLPGSLYCVCAYHGTEIIGMGRVIGDGGLVYYVQDVIVVPQYQHQGVGTRLMDCIMGYIRKRGARNVIVGLMAAHGKEPFYERYGFVRRPNDRLGCGMTIFWEG
jgi:GNAT superfamily N-acetyltransferase